MLILRTCLPKNNKVYLADILAYKYLRFPLNSFQLWAK